jgi:hypothetical protein
LILQNFYNELTSTSRAHIDAAAGGAFFSLTVSGATTLIEKMVSNQGWSEDRLQPQEDSMHTMEETDMLATKLDLLIKRLDEHDAIKGTPYGTVQSLYLHIPCEVYGNFRHSGNDCLETREDALNNNNRFHPQGGLGWKQSHPSYQEGNFAYNLNFANQPSLIDLVLRQAQINENLTKKLASNNEMFENINSNLEGFNFSFENQLSLNKMFETQLAQIAATIPTYDFENILGQPKISFEYINAVITRDGKSTRDLPYPNHASEAQKARGYNPEPETLS